MFCVMVNQHGLLNDWGEFVSFEEARDEAERLIRESHGGDVWVVPAEEAERLQGEDAASTRFPWYDYQGRLRRPR